jgi:hypothetical protein
LFVELRFGCHIVVIDAWGFALRETAADPVDDISIHWDTGTTIAVRAGCVPVPVRMAEQWRIGCPNARQG